MVDSSAPMPWIGLYAAAASLVWVLALVADMIHSIRHLKLWFPCKYSALNAASLTLIAIAVKLAMDLTTNMPGGIDQFAKLSSTALLCASTIHFMPSLGSMSDRDILVNLTALGILIVTLSVNVTIQMVTGVINSRLKIAYAIPVSLNVYSFIVLISFAIKISASKRYLEHKYKELQGAMLEEELRENEMFDTDKIKSRLSKYWMMAKTGSPQFVMVRSEAYYFFGLMSTIFLILTTLSLSIPIWRPDPSSDYKRSVEYIVYCQVLAMCLCILTSVIRIVNALILNIWHVKKFAASIISLGMKTYEVKRLVEWKKRPLPLQVRDPKLRRFIYLMKNLLTNISIGAQLVIVLTNKLLGLASIFGILGTIILVTLILRDYILLVVSILFFILCFKKPRETVESFFVIVKKIILKESEASAISNESGMEIASQMTYILHGLVTVGTIGTIGIIIWLAFVKMITSAIFVPFLVFFFKRPRKATIRYLKRLKKIISRESKVSTNPSETEHRPPGHLQELRNHVLVLEGEIIQDKYLEFIHTSMNLFTKLGAKQCPRYLMDLLENSTNFNGVLDFESDQVSTIILEEPPSCWSLPVVVLTTIVVALPNIQKQKKDRLLRGVIEGFKYVQLVESMDTPKRLVRSKEAAEFVWIGVELKHKWLHVDLKKLACESQSSRETLETLAILSEELLEEFKNNVNWPDNIVAANSMYKISKTLLLHDLENDQVFDKICTMVADIFAACLTNLPHVILEKCYKNVIEEWEQGVEEAACLYGETQHILKALNKYEIPCLSHGQLAYIEEWRASLKRTLHMV